MAISEYLRRLRAHVGQGLLMVPCVAAVIHDTEGGVLLQRRSDGGLWSLPAGAIDPGEAPAEAIVRETLEETGLRVRPRRVLGVFGGSAGFRHRYPNGDEVEYLCVLFSCDVLGGTLGGRDDETIELRYFGREAMPALSIGYPRDVFWRSEEEAYFQGLDSWQNIKT